MEVTIASELILAGGLKTARVYKGLFYTEVTPGGYSLIWAI